jgi:hypothetical protein
VNLEELLSTTHEKRDNQWESKFLDAFVNSKVEVISEDPQQGPEGFPYLLVKTGGSEPVAKVIDWLSTRGIGLCVNPQNENPDYVFSYGMIWNFKERNRFLEPIAHTRSNRMELKEGEKLFSGDISAEFFPPYARSIVREFLLQQGVLAPKVLALTTNQKDYDICFSLNSLGRPDTKEHQGIAEALSWFFPFNTSIVLIEEKNLPSFYPL